MNTRKTGAKQHIKNSTRMDIRHTSGCWTRAMGQGTENKREKKSKPLSNQCVLASGIQAALSQSHRGAQTRLSTRHRHHLVGSETQQAICNRWTLKIPKTIFYQINVTYATALKKKKKNPPHNQMALSTATWKIIYFPTTLSTYS